MESMKDYLESGLSQTPSNRMQSRNQNYGKKNSIDEERQKIIYIKNEKRRTNACKVDENFQNNTCTRVKVYITPPGC